MGKTVNKPLIALACGFDVDKGRYSLPKEYFDSIEGAGAIPFMVPFTESVAKSDEIASFFDGLLLCGGPDADPVFYGEECSRGNGDICPERDLTEINLVKSFYNTRKPILAICRGIQLLNVAFGGTLHQDIYSDFSSTALQHSQRAPKWYPNHKIQITRGSFISKCFNNELSGKVNSFHHQAIKDIAENFTATSYSPDGIIESIEYSGDTKDFIAIGVQWHPELMVDKDIFQKNIFSEFINLVK